jgi:hypothetical protein
MRYQSSAIRTRRACRHLRAISEASQHPQVGSYSRHNGEMSGTLLVGTGREIRRVPDDDFLQAIQRIPARMASRLAFMAQDHHTVRNFVVRELPGQRRSLSARHIANATGMGFVARLRTTR